MTETRFGSVDEYIGSFPAEVQQALRRIRDIIKLAAPAAEETISYHMPAVHLGGAPLIYFAAWKRHISIYPAPRGDESLEHALADYRSDKSTLKFPLSRPLPYDLIEAVVNARIAEQPHDR